MGLIKHKHTVETVDLHNYDPEYNEDGTEKHKIRKVIGEVDDE